MKMLLGLSRRTTDSFTSLCLQHTFSPDLSLNHAFKFKAWTVHAISLLLNSRTYVSWPVGLLLNSRTYASWPVGLLLNSRTYVSWPVNLLLNSRTCVSWCLHFSCTSRLASFRSGPVHASIGQTCDSVLNLLWGRRCEGAWFSFINVESGFFTACVRGSMWPLFTEFTE